MISALFIGPAGYWRYTLRTRICLALHLRDSYSYLEMISAILSYLYCVCIIGPAGHQTYRALVIGPAGQQTYRAIAILSYLFGATPYRLEFVSRDDLGNTVGFSATPYRHVFVSALVIGPAGYWRYTLRTRICLSRCSQQYCRVWRYNLRIYIWNAPSFWRWG